MSLKVVFLHLIKKVETTLTPDQYINSIERYDFSHVGLK
jgi:hypothetical protein